jgi:polar amino acid transport system substrate-binding protein
MKQLPVYLTMILLIVSLLAAACAVPTTVPPATTTSPVTTATSTKTGAIKIKVATDATWPPFESINTKSMAVEGFDIDLLNAVAAREGLVVEFSNVNFNTLLADMAQCKYDAAISSITITAERKRTMFFSDPYFAAGQMVTVSSNNTDIKSKNNLYLKRVGVQSGSTGATELEKIPGVIVKPYDDIDQAFLDLISAKLDAVVADNPLATVYVGKNPGKLKTVGIVFTEEYYGIAVCNKNKSLLDKINNGLKLVKNDGTVDNLIKKWFYSQ